MYITFASAMPKSRTPSGIETQRRRHQKSKTGVSVVPKIEHVNVSDKKLLKKKVWSLDHTPSVPPPKRGPGRGSSNRHFFGTICNTPNFVKFIPAHKLRSLIPRSISVKDTHGVQWTHV